MVPQPLGAGDAVPPAPAELVRLFWQFSGFRNAGLALGPEDPSLAGLGQEGMDNLVFLCDSPKPRGLLAQGLRGRVVSCS